MSDDARTSMHVGALMVLEQSPLLDAAGHLRLVEIRLRLLHAEIPAREERSRSYASAAILSYAGGLNLSVCADAERFSNLHVPVAGMERSWARLLNCVSSTASRTHRPSRIPSRPDATDI